ncbi:hypothetical protein H9P43_001517 [Blastocladiella emersonii ATCC 22665]|nr:hypothetical protein H9P43_001517 [Blastocladiella emersonii ATCC 22665]
MENATGKGLPPLPATAPRPPPPPLPPRRSNTAGVPLSSPTATTTNFATLPYPQRAATLSMYQQHPQQHAAAGAPVTPSTILMAAGATDPATPGTVPTVERVLHLPIVDALLTRALPPLPGSESSHSLAPALSTSSSTAALVVPTDAAAEANPAPVARPADDDGDAAAAVAAADPPAPSGIDEAVVEAADAATDAADAAATTAATATEADDDEDAHQVVEDPETVAVATALLDQALARRHTLRRMHSVRRSSSPTRPAAAAATLEDAAHHDVESIAEEVSSVGAIADETEPEPALSLPAETPLLSAPEDATATVTPIASTGPFSPSTTVPVTDSATNPAVHALIHGDAADTGAGYDRRVSVAESEYSLSSLGPAAVSTLERIHDRSRSRVLTDYHAIFHPESPLVRAAPMNMDDEPEADGASAAPAPGPVEAALMAEHDAAAAAFAFDPMSPPAVAVVPSSDESALFRRALDILEQRQESVLGSPPFVSAPTSAAAAVVPAPVEDAPGDEPVDVAAAEPALASADEDVDFEPAAADAPDTVAAAVDGNDAESVPEPAAPAAAAVIPHKSGLNDSQVAVFQQAVDMLRILTSSSTAVAATEELAPAAAPEEPAEAAPEESHEVQPVERGLPPLPSTDRELPLPPVPTTTDDSADALAPPADRAKRLSQFPVLPEAPPNEDDAEETEPAPPLQAEPAPDAPVEHHDAPVVQGMATLGPQSVEFNDLIHGPVVHVGTPGNAEDDDLILPSSVGMPPGVSATPPMLSPVPGHAALFASPEPAHTNAASPISPTSPLPSPLPPAAPEAAAAVAQHAPQIRAFRPAHLSNAPIGMSMSRAQSQGSMPPAPGVPQIHVPPPIQTAPQPGAPALAMPTVTSPANLTPSPTVTGPPRTASVSPAVPDSPVVGMARHPPRSSSARMSMMMGPGGSAPPSPIAVGPRVQSMYVPNTGSPVGAGGTGAPIMVRPVVVGPGGVPLAFPQQQPQQPQFVMGPNGVPVPIQQQPGQPRPIMMIRPAGGGPPVPVAMVPGAAQPQPQVMMVRPGQPPVPVAPGTVFPGQHPQPQVVYQNGQPVLIRPVFVGGAPPGAPQPQGQIMMVNGQQVFVRPQPAPQAFYGMAPRPAPAPAPPTPAAEEEDGPVLIKFAKSREEREAEAREAEERQRLAEQQQRQGMMQPQRPMSVYNPQTGQIMLVQPQQPMPMQVHHGMQPVYPQQQQFAQQQQQFAPRPQYVPVMQQLQQHQQAHAVYSQPPMQGTPVASPAVPPQPQHHQHPQQQMMMQQAPSVNSISPALGPGMQPQQQPGSSATSSLVGGLSTPSAPASAPSTAPPSRPKTPPSEPLVTLIEVDQRRDAVKKNDAQAQTEFAKWLLREAARLPDRSADQKHRMYDEALAILKKMADSGTPGAYRHGYPEAQFFLAELFRKGAFGSQRNLDKAFAYYTKASKAGHAPSTYYRGLMFELGHGTRVNEAKALTLYRTAAAAGVTAAALKLGFVYSRGLLRQKPNEASSLLWLKRAAADVATAVQMVVAGGGGNDESKETQDLVALASRNVYALHACFLLGNHYERSASAAERESAYQFFLDAAELGYPPAMFKAAMCLRDGVGAERDGEAAQRWFRDAAAAGVTTLAHINNLPLPV